MTAVNVGPALDVVGAVSRVVNTSNLLVRVTLEW